MHEVLVNRLGGLSLPRKSVVRLTDRPDMTLDVYRGRKTTIQYQKKMNTAKEPESCTGRKLSFYFTFLCDPDLGQRTLILIMTYHLIIVYLFMKSN